MKKMIVAMAAMMLLIGTGAEAQGRRDGMHAERPTPEQIAQKRTERMTKELSLNEEQAKQVYDLTFEQAQKGAQQRAKAEAAMNERMERMKAAREADAQKMKMILTPEQYAKWEQMQADREKKCQRHGRKHNRDCKNECMPKKCCGNGSSK